MPREKTQAKMNPSRILILLTFLLPMTAAFVPPAVPSLWMRIDASSATTLVTARKTAAVAAAAATATRLQERRWNFNEGQSPWGLKKNAEIWNGRVAQVCLITIVLVRFLFFWLFLTVGSFVVVFSQMAFVLVFLQELIQGKGVLKGIQEGDPVNIAAVGAFLFVVIGLSAFLAFKGDDDYVNPTL